MTKPKRVRVRVPWHEREPKINEWCTCTWVWHETPAGPERVGIHSADPDCKLHAPGHDLPDTI